MSKKFRIFLLTITIAVTVEIDAKLAAANLEVTPSAHIWGRKIIAARV